VDAQAAGYLVNCPHCGRRLQIPRTADTGAARPAQPTADTAQTLREKMAELQRENRLLRERLSRAEQVNRQNLGIESKTAELQQQVETLTERLRRTEDLDQENEEIQERFRTLSENYRQRLRELKRAQQRVAELEARGDRSDPAERPATGEPGGEPEGR
jgi:DNA repair exonuclease SbcCD ATPase subunit